MARLAEHKPQVLGVTTSWEGGNRGLWPHLTMEPGHHQLGLSTGGDEPDLDSVVVAEYEEQRHVRALAVQTGVVDVRRLEPGPGDLALGVLCWLVESLHLVDKSCK